MSKYGMRKEASELHKGAKASIRGLLDAAQETSDRAPLYDAATMIEGLADHLIEAGATITELAEALEAMRSLSDYATPEQSLEARMKAQAALEKARVKA